MSWTEIGAAVGMSKQGVAQKFDRAKLKGEHPESNSKNQEIIRFGATLLNEVGMLEVEGRNGLELQRGQLYVGSQRQQLRLARRILGQ